MASFIINRPSFFSPPFRSSIEFHSSFAKLPHQRRLSFQFYFTRNETRRNVGDGKEEKEKKMVEISRKFTRFNFRGKKNSLIKFFD